MLHLLGPGDRLLRPLLGLGGIAQRPQHARQPDPQGHLGHHATMEERREGWHSGREATAVLQLGPGGEEVPPIARHRPPD